MCMRFSAPVFVLGALNLDLYGAPIGALRPRDSAPGRVTVAAGGVGHNMARHLASFGVPVELVAPLGDDGAAALLRAQLSKEGIGLSHALSFSGPSCAYLCLHDEQGDMAAAVNDMALMDRFTPECLGALWPLLDGSPLVLADANLPEETLCALAERAKVPLFLDPVSGVKAGRARSVIGRFAAVKPNRLEAQSLSGEEDPARAAEWFLQEGVGRVFISLGAEGVYYASANERGRLPAVRVRQAHYTGAGDAMAAGIALGMLKGLDARGCAQSGMEAVVKHLICQGGTLL